MGPHIVPLLIWASFVIKVAAGASARYAPQDAR